MELKKKGVFFSADAMAALLIIMIVLLVAFPLVTRVSPESEVQADVLNSLSNLQVGKVDSAYVQSLISSGVINETNKSLLQQIGEFAVFDVSRARLLAEDVLSDLDTNQNIGIWYDNSLVYSNNKTAIEDADEIDVSRQVVSGLQVGNGTTGFSARASLSSSSRNEFFYFGGYVGDGNISVSVNYEGVLASAEIEAVVNNDFNLYVNDILEGIYPGSVDEFTPIVENISTNLFNNGVNLVELRGENLHTAGGFVRISYDNGTLIESGTKRYQFPGIAGFVNLYDGFYVPGQLSEMEISLHLNSSVASTFLNVGNVTVFNGTTVGEQTILFSDSALSSLLDYNSLSFENTPLRLGLANATYGGVLQEVDVFSVTDLSGSMRASCNGGSFWCCLFSGDFCGSQNTCNSCGGVLEDKLSAAKEANNIFIDAILNSTGNRVGLQGYKNDASPDDFHVLSSNTGSLKSEVASWGAGGSTCICCGINAAVNSLLSDSNSSKFRSFVVMSDGEANVECAEQGSTPDLNGNGNVDDAGDDAIQAACDAFNNYGMQISAVGFGSDADETTLQAIASCGGGAYYFGDVSDLAEIYEDVAADIIATYVEQTVEVLGSVPTRLYPDSYIDFTYSAQQSPFGLLATIEKDFDDASSGEFFVPLDASILEARVTSYSGPRWTDEVKINGAGIYNLSSYGENYIGLGDPFNFVIPNSLILSGNNSVEVSTGVAPGNSTFGSESNKIIYTLLKNASSFSPIVASAEGCIWTLEFEDGSVINVAVPSSYSGSDVCTYTSSGQVVADGENDAFEVAVLELLEKLDIDGDGKIDVIFTAQDLELSLDEITGIPFTWSTEVQVRRWLP